MSGLRLEGKHDKLNEQRPRGPGRSEAMALCASSGRGPRRGHCICRGRRIAAAAFVASVPVAADAWRGHHAHRLGLTVMPRAGLARVRDALAVPDERQRELRSRSLKLRLQSVLLSSVLMWLREK